MTASCINVELMCYPSVGNCNGYDFNAVSRDLQIESNVWTQLFTFNDVRYIRVSCQIYNHLDEYDKFAEIFESLVEKHKNL